MPVVVEGFGRHIGGSIAVALVVALAPVSALAQSLTAARLGAIEQHIRQLERELHDLKRELGTTRQQLRQSQREAAGAQAQAKQAQQAATEVQAKAQAKITAAPPPPAPPAPHVVQTAGNRFGLESADGRNSIYLTGRVHLDVGDYLDYHAQSKAASVQNLNSGVNARRARLGVTGKFAGDWTYNLIYDFGGTADGFPPDPGGGSSGIQSAYVTYNGVNKGPVPLAFDLGYMDTPFTLDEATSSNDIMFMERPTIQAIASSIMAGDSRSAFGVRSNDDRYWVGAYVTGPQSGATHNTGEQMGAAARATYQLLQAPDYSLHVGADVGGLLKPPAPGGFRTITLSDRPELRIDPTVILSTGALGTAAHPLDNAVVYGAEAAAGYENFFLQGEYYHIGVNRQGLPSNGFNGGYVEGSWTLTGEHRKYIPATGAYSGIVPEHPFSPWGGEYGFGAFELASRFSAVDLNDRFIPGAAPGTTGAVGGGEQTVYAVGLNWYPNANIRFLFDYLHGSIDKRFSIAAGGAAASTALGTAVGGTFDALAMRMQFAF